MATTATKVTNHESVGKPTKWNEPGNFMQLYGWVEALFFASDRPLKMDDLLKILSDMDESIRLEHLESVIREMVASYSHPIRGFFLSEVADGWQFRTNLQYTQLLRKLFAHNPPRISQAALESMSIVAYRQPITRAEIDAIRGVDSGGVLRGLLDRGLVEMVGRAKSPGRPYLYGTSPEFLEYFGLRSLMDLPSFHELSMPIPESVGPADSEKEGQSEETPGKKRKRLSSRKRAENKALDLYEFMSSGPLSPKALFPQNTSEDGVGQP